MKNVTKMTSDERKIEFTNYLRNRIKSAETYIRDLERGFAEAPVLNYESIYDITDPKILEDRSKTKALRESSVFTRQSPGGTSGLAGLNNYIRFLKDSRDSYYNFMDYFNIKQNDLFDWGMKAIIFPPKEIIESEWTNLKNRIFNNEEVHIRGYGRDAHGTQLFIDLYKAIFNNEHITKDRTNNSNPARIMKALTGLTRNKDIYNYQVSHIWGHTKNIFMFEAPWNICYIPKIIDPLTGHETKGDLPIDFQEYFIKYMQKKYKKYIDDYNSIISNYNIDQLIRNYCQEYGIDNDRFITDAKNELSPIQLL